MEGDRRMWDGRWQLWLGVARFVGWMEAHYAATWEENSPGRKKGLWCLGFNRIALSEI
jgi:hypothetical protein